MYETRNIFRVGESGRDCLPNIVLCTIDTQKKKVICDGRGWAYKVIQYIVYMVQQ